MYTKHPVECVHHWVFPAPSGPTSIGICKKCGEKQEADNHMETSPINSYRMKAVKKKKKMETPR